jgi:hypothetical protein
VGLSFFAVDPVVTGLTHHFNKLKKQASKKAGK